RIEPPFGIDALATNIRAYSITSSAMASSPGERLRLNALAVLRLITNSNLLDCMTGRSAGFSPLRIRPVYTPAWRYASLGLNVRDEGLCGGVVGIDQHAHALESASSRASSDC